MKFHSSIPGSLAMFDGGLLLFGFLFLGGLLLCFTLLVVGLFKRSRRLTFIGAIAPVLGIATLVLLGAIARVTDPFPRLQSAPDEAALPGTYMLAEHSVELLRSLGFADGSGSIILRENHTFAVVNLPRILTVTIPPNLKHPNADYQGYFTGEGQWSVRHYVGGPEFILSLSTGRTDIPFKGTTMTAFFIAPKKERKDYGLAAWVTGHADNEAVYLKQPTATSPSPASTGKP